MHYLISVIDRFTGSATPQEMEAIDTFNDSVRDRGWWVLAAGLEEPAKSRVVDGRGSASVVADGPLVEAPEHLSGFWIVDLPDSASIVPLALDASRACNRRVEVREFLGG
ncbi:hypothetical protein RN607_07120 [Demequina capsici]|uniref:YCII-related domain-containing protein n=1 Tax=Demequina capsici TaxID=3075620 RepID=A0AA96JE38_9MICO|nr:hypothetical protein [Demequina sp. PMTSA13]WNM28771.1 hypothetical protein RN607_07120 [Demequina sp. PMTSA13]